MIGLVALLWSSLGFFSALESGLNVLYGLPNRGFLHQKLVMLGLLGVALIGLLLGLTIVVTSQTALSEVAPGLSQPRRLAHRRRPRDQHADDVPLPAARLSHAAEHRA